MIRKTDLQYGPEARDRLAETTDPSRAGARAALESFYYALNNRNVEALSDDWADHPLVQLNNPLGRMLRGGDAVGSSTRGFSTARSGSRSPSATWSSTSASGTRCSRAVRRGRTRAPAAMPRRSRSAPPATSDTRTERGGSSTTTAASTTRRPSRPTSEPQARRERQSTTLAEGHEDGHRGRVAKRLGRSADRERPAAQPPPRADRNSEGVTPCARLNALANWPGWR
jgi:hypothetical protein